MTSKTLIFVCCHNQQKILETFNIKSILVGAENSKLDIYLYKDNIGDNISLKNPNYNELTGQYWVWKNLRNLNSKDYQDQRYSEAIIQPEDYTHIGFFHYRRYLALRNTIFPKKFLVNFPTLMNYIFGFNEKNIQSLSQNFDIILPKKHPNVVINKYISKETTMKEHFIYNDSVNVVEEIEKIILEKFPEYKKALEISWAEKKSYFKNIFIMKKEYFNEYMNFIFSILFEFDKRNKDDKITSKKRINGFIAERLLNIHINKLILDNKNIQIAEFALLRRNYINIINRSYFNKQLLKLKTRLNFSYFKYLFYKLIKKA